jgi:hypothetical protein
MYFWCYNLRTPSPLVDSLNLNARVFKKLEVIGEGCDAAKAIHGKPV